MRGLVHAPAREPEVEPPLAEDVERGRVGAHLEGVMEGQHAGRQADADAPGVRRQVGGREHGRRPEQIPARKVALREPHAVEAEGVRFDDLVDHVEVGAVPAAHEEDAELHGRLPSRRASRVGDMSTSVSVVVSMSSIGNEAVRGLE